MNRIAFLVVVACLSGCGIAQTGAAEDRASGSTDAAGVSVTELTQFNIPQTITNAYKKVLWRNPDAVGLAIHVTKMEQDTSLDQQWLETCLEATSEAKDIRRAYGKGMQQLWTGCVIVLLSGVLVWIFFRKQAGFKALFLMFLLMYPPFVIRHGFGEKRVRNEDFPSFYGAAQLVFCRGESPYTSEARAKISDITDGPAFPYLYPPTSLLMFRPFSSMSFKDAKEAMLYLNRALVLGVLCLSFLFLRHAIGGAPPERVGVLCLVYYFLFDPLRSSIFHGQVNLGVIAFVLLFFLMLMRNRDILAACFLACAIVLKTYPGVLVVLLLARRRYRASVAVICLLLLWTIASAALLPVCVWRDWVINVLPFGGYGKSPMGLFSPASVWNQNVNGFLSRAFVNNEFNAALIHIPTLARSLSYAISISLLVLVAYLCRVVQGKHGDRYLGVEVALFLTVMFLISPFSWFHHLVFLVPACFFLIDRSLRNYRPVTALFCWACLCLVAWHWYLWPDNGVILRYRWSILLASSRFYGVLGILGLLLAELIKASRSEPACGEASSTTAGTLPGAAACPGSFPLDEADRVEASSGPYYSQVLP